MHHNEHIRHTESHGCIKLDTQMQHTWYRETCFKHNLLQDKLVHGAHHSSPCCTGTSVSVPTRLYFFNHPNQPWPKYTVKAAAFVSHNDHRTSKRAIYTRERSITLVTHRDDASASQFQKPEIP